jgi:hypothetical protein
MVGGWLKGPYRRASPAKMRDDHQSKLAWVQEGVDGANLKAGWGGVRSGVASR